MKNTHSVVNKYANNFIFTATEYLLKFPKNSTTFSLQKYILFYF